MVTERMGVFSAIRQEHRCGCAFGPAGRHQVCPPLARRGSYLSKPRLPLPVYVVASGRDAAVSEQRGRGIMSLTHVCAEPADQTRGHTGCAGLKKETASMEKTFIVFANPVRTLENSVLSSTSSRPKSLLMLVYVP